MVTGGGWVGEWVVVLAVVLMLVVVLTGVVVVCYKVALRQLLAAE